MDSSLKELDKTLFYSCTNELSYDEFLYNDLFDSKNAMNALELSYPRLDAHLAQNGEYSIAELQSTGRIILDEDATIDDVISICSSFLLLQSLRFNGEDLQLTLFTSVYINKNYEIKNPLLKLMFKVFSVASYSIETFVYNLGLFNASCWSYFENLSEFINNFDIKEVRTEVDSFSDFPEILKNLANFELNLAEFFNSIYEQPVPDLPELPVGSSESGIAKFLAYRTYIVSNPTHKPISTTLEQAHNTFKQLIQELTEAKEVFREPSNSVFELFNRIIEWNTPTPKVSLTRFVILSLILHQFNPNPEQSFDVFLKKELTLAHVQSSFFLHPDYKTFSNSTYCAVRTICRHLILPTASAQGFLVSHGHQYWHYVQYLGFTLQQNSALPAKLPKCHAIEFQRCTEMPFPLWSTRIASLLLETIIRWGFSSQLYSILDYHIDYYVLEMASKTSALTLLQKRTLDAIYNAKARMGKKNDKKLRNEDVNRSLANPTPEEIFHLCKNELYSGYFHSIRIFKKWKSMNFDAGLFFDERKLFESRQSPSVKMMHFASKTYEDFASSVEPGINDKDFIRLQAISHFSKSKEYLMQYLGMVHTKTPETTEMMRANLMNIIFLNKFTENDKVKFNFASHPVFPLFELDVTNTP